ncbi:MAG: TetR/AcrR family transcriptional regulator [Acidimicrobiia bacterium]|nr:TetR/AcrR family transcriptional regulator [Acidimicrobiia bacterium]
MSGKSNIDRKTARRQATQAEIVAASWDLVREHGLAGLAMRDLGERVGMRAQSIYSYFASKHEIYDAMFLEGYQAFADVLGTSSGVQIEGDPVAAAKETAKHFVQFCSSDPARYQLLFQRTIPGFEPSPESYAVAIEVYEYTRELLAAVGVHDEATLDLWTATMTGLADQQISNDPGGDRWLRLTDRAVEMLLTDVQTQTTEKAIKA